MSIKNHASNIDYKAGLLILEKETRFLYYQTHENLIFKIKIMSALETNGDSFKTDVLEVKGMPVIVDFWAPWCGPCQTQGPIIDELSDEVEGKAKIVKVNVDENTDLASQYGIMSIPALKVFKNGEVVEEMVGVHDKKQLMEVIEKHS